VAISLVAKETRVKYLGGDGDLGDAAHQVFRCFCRVQIAVHLILLVGLAFGVFGGAVFGSDVEVVDDDGLAGLGLGGRGAVVEGVFEGGSVLGGINLL